MPVRGQPSAPRVVFKYSGDIVTMLTFRIKRREGRQFMVCFFLPDYYTMEKYDIRNEQLNRTIDSRGILIREYPRHLMRLGTSNPENPIYIAYVNFDGTMASYGDDMDEMVNEIQSLHDVVDRLHAENETMQEQVKDLAEQLRLLRSRGTEVD